MSRLRAGLPPLGSRWRARLLAALLFVVACALGGPATMLLLARTLGATVPWHPAELLGLGAALGLGGAFLASAYWVLADQE